MAAGIPARLSAAEGRRFGLTVGAAFLAIAGLAWWRGRPLLSSVLAGLGLALVAAAVLLPGRLGPVYRLWMGLATALSHLTTPVVLGLLYFAILTPIGALRRVAGRNLRRRPGPATGFWVVRSPDERTRRDMQHQF